MTEPYYGNIEEDTVENDYYRKVIYTGKIQLVLMSLMPGEDIPAEVHEDHDQFFRVEEGNGLIYIDNEEYPLIKDHAVIVPAGSLHYVTNIGDTPLRLYTIYGPPEHPGDRADVYQPVES